MMIILFISLIYKHFTKIIVTRDLITISGNYIHLCNYKVEIKKMTVATYILMVAQTSSMGNTTENSHLKIKKNFFQKLTVKIWKPKRKYFQTNLYSRKGIMNKRIMF